MKSIFQSLCHMLAKAAVVLLIIGSSGCGGNGMPDIVGSNMVPVAVALKVPGQALAHNDYKVLDNVLDIVIGDAHAAVVLTGLGVKSVTISVTGADFLTVTDTFNAIAGTTMTRALQIPQGANRTFTIQGYNAVVGAGGVITYTGSVLVPTLAAGAAGAAVAVNIPIAPTAAADLVPPVVTAPAALTVAATNAQGTLKSSPTIATFLAAATAVDAVDGAIFPANNGPATFPLGTTIVTFSASDTSGNIGAANSSVTIVDQTKPVIALTGASPLTVAQGSVFADPGTTVTDNVDVGLIAAATGVVDTAVVGAYILSYNVTDAAGNLATTVTRTVNVTPVVVDVTPPVITLSGVSPVNVNQGTAYVDAGAIASDNVDGVISANIVTTNPVNIAVLGAYTVTYNVTDAAGNAATPVTRIVNVIPTAITGATASISGASCNTTWTAASIYHVTAPVTIAPTCTLQVAAGAIIKFAPATSITVQNGGTFNVTGTAGAHATFSSIKDDLAGGDTNADAGATTPAAGNWGGVVFAFGSLGSMAFADLNYVANGLNVQSSPTINDVKVLNASGTAINVAGATVAPVMNNITLSSSATGLFLSSATLGSYSNFFINGGAGGAIRLAGNPTTLSNITINSGTPITFFGANAASIPAGATFTLGAGVPNTVILSTIGQNTQLIADPLNQMVATGTPSVWHIPAILTVANAQTLSIGQGTIVKADPNAMISVAVGGTLNVNGASGSPVVMTSIKDDSIGGDTNGDGNVSVAAAGDWSGIDYLTGSLGAISFLDMKHTFTALRFFSSRQVNDLNIMNDSSTSILVDGGSAPVMSNVSVSTPWIGLYVMPGATGSYTNFTFNLTGLATTGFEAGAYLLGAPTVFDGMTFQSYPANSTPLQLGFNNTTTTFNNLNFMSLLTTGFHIGGTGASNTITVASSNLTPGTTSAAFDAALNTVTWPSPAPVGTTHVWTGATSTVWNVGTNWNVGTVPSLTSIVFIPAVAVNQPVLTGNQSIFALETEAGSTLNIAGNITFGTGIVNRGTIDFNTLAGTLTINGGGTLTNLGSVVGNVAGASIVIAADINNFGTITANQNMGISNAGGILRADLGGTIHVAAAKTLNIGAGGSTAIDAANSFWTGSGTVFFGISHTVTLIGNVVHPAGTGGTVFDFDTATVNGTGTLTNNGTMGVSIASFNSLVNNGNIVGVDSMTVNGLFSSTPGSSIIGLGGGVSTLSLNGGVSMNTVTVDSVLIAINTTAPTQFDNVTFQNYLAIDTPLLLNFSNATGANALTFNNLNYNTALTTGLHIGGAGNNNTINIASSNLPFGTGTVSIPFSTAIPANTVNWPVAPTAAVGWQKLKASGDTALASLEFVGVLNTTPTDVEAVIGLCTTQMADLMADPAFRALLTTWTTDTGATLPTAVGLAMNIANGSKTIINWQKKFSQLALNGATVQADGFLTVMPALDTCITHLENVLLNGFVSQAIQNPASWVSLPATTVTVDVADVNMLLSILYGARSEIYWLDAYNWNTDVDADLVVDTDITSAVINLVTYQYSTMNIDPKSVLADPAFFTLRAAGTVLGSGLANLTQSLGDAVLGVSKRKAALTTFSGNALRAGNSANLFYYTPVNLLNVTQDLTDSTNALAAIDGTGYTDPLFNQPGAAAATATIRADFAYTGVTAWDRAVMPFALMAYDVVPDLVASKKNNSPTYFDNGLGNVVKSNLYNTAYPDATMKGVLSGAALLSNQDISARPVSSIALNIAGVPITRNRVYTDVNGFHIVSWPGNILTNETGTVLFALEVDQNITTGNSVFTLYSVNQTTGVLTAVPGATGTLAGIMNGSGFVSGVSNIYIPGSQTGVNGYWDMNLTALTVTFTA
ncbi:MAG: DUF5011 domain-containing protein, partial [Mariprofundus sp.]|nr:DUF5011 domain-containing protein [Mariprofundus sp.]